MLHSQIVVLEPEPRLTPALQELAAAERWACRDPRQRRLCRELLETRTPTVFVLRLGKSPDDDLAMLCEVTDQCLHVVSVVVGSVDDADTLAGLAWDCGAEFALFPPLSRDLLPDVVRGLMRRAAQRCAPGATT